MAIKKALSLHQKRGVRLEIIGVILCDIIIIIIIIIVRPPSGDPKADPQEYWLLQCTLYGLHHSP
jgi:hypothetical protein